MITPASMPDDRRFRRVRGRPVRPRRGWLGGLLKLVQIAAVAGALGLAGVRAGAYLHVADMFNVKRIDVHGSEYLRAADVQAALADERGRNIFRVDLAAARTRLLQIPWVETAALHRMLPDGIEASIVERTPAALAQVGAELYLMDATGVLIDRYGPAYRRFRLPVVTGLPAPDERGGIDGPRVWLASSVLQALAARPAVMARVSSLDVSDPYDATVLLDRDSVLVRLGTDDFAERLAGWLTYAPALRDRAGDLDYVDLRYGDRVFVKPIGAAAPPSAAAGPDRAGSAR